MRITMYEASKTACKTERAFPYQLKEEKSYRYDKTAALKKVFHDAVDKIIPLSEVKDRVAEAFKDIPKKSDLQREIEIEDTARWICRYVTSEPRKLTTAATADVEVSPELTVNISPDYWYIDRNPICVEGEVLAEMTVELIKIKIGKKYDSDKELLNDIGLYAMLLEARKKVPDGVKAVVKASYYYLRRSDDKNGSKPHFAPNFFETGGGNIAVMAEDYVGGSTTPMAADTRLQPVISEFLSGKESEECSKEECEKCILRNICHYSEPPVKIKVNMAAKQLSDINLTPDQQKAIDYRSGIVRINAGAGAGKTTVIALRVASMIADGVDPGSIFLTTFTNSGAEEMRERIKSYITDFGLDDIDVSNMVICTFNAYGNEVIKKEYARLGFPKEPTVIDDIERSAIISRMLNEANIPGLDYRNFQMDSTYVKGALPMTKKVFEIIKAKQYGLGEADFVYNDLDYCRRFVTKEAVEKLLELYDEYDQKMRDEALIEFSDQEVLMMQLLNEDPYYMDQFGYEHIIVDEFQDSNDNQIRFLQILSESPSFKSLMVVGDDNQAIYAFRGTTPEYIINFHKYFAGKKVDDICLLENQRSKKEIIEFANKIAGLNKVRVIKSLVPTRPSGKPVIVRGFLDKDEEMDYIVNGIESKIKAGTVPEDIAFIAATKTELIRMGALLAERNIPSVMMNPEPFLENSRVLAAIGFFKFMADREDTKDAVTFINASIGGGIENLAEDEIDERIAELDDRIVKLEEMEGLDQMLELEKILRDIDHSDDEIYQAFLDKILKKPFLRLVEYIRDYEEFGKAEAKRRDHKYPGVVLTTAHSSKGLEWPVVFNSISNYDSEDLHKSSAWDKVEEKRRLLFVSCTRARDELIVTGRYSAFGSIKTGYTYNQFLIELFEINGMEFSPSSIEAQRDLKRKEQREKKKAETNPEKEKAENNPEKEKPEAAEPVKESSENPNAA